MIVVVGLRFDVGGDGVLNSRDVVRRVGDGNVVGLILIDLVLNLGVGVVILLR